MPSNKPEQTLILEFFTSINSKRGMAKVCAIDLEIQGGFLFPQWTFTFPGKTSQHLTPLQAGILPYSPDNVLLHPQRTDLILQFASWQKNGKETERISSEATVGVVGAKSVEAYIPCKPSSSSFCWISPPSFLPPFHHPNPSGCHMPQAIFRFSAA